MKTLRAQIGQRIERDPRTQAAIAAAAGWKQSQLSAWLAGRRRAREDSLDALIAALGGAKLQWRKGRRA